MLDVTTAFGLTFTFPAADSAVGHSLRTYGEFARAEVDLISHYAGVSGSNRLIIDVGANLGAICLPLAARHRQTQVIAFEPQRRIHALLCANAANNRLFNVECHHAALGREDGVMPFPSIPLSTRGNFGDVGAHVAHVHPAVEPVLVRRLDSMALSPVGFIKIDVQGAELEVLQGAVETIRRDRPALLLEVTRSEPERTKAVSDFMFALDYRLLVFFSPFASPKADKFYDARPSLRGDFSFLALPPDVPNAWDLQDFVSIDDPWPADLKNFGYLKRYGH